MILSVVLDALFVEFFLQLNLCSEEDCAFSVREERPVPTSGSMLFKKHMKKEETSTPKTSDMSVAAQAKAASLSALKEKKLKKNRRKRSRRGPNPRVELSSRFMEQLQQHLV